MVRMFQSQRRFFGGSNPFLGPDEIAVLEVSIAEAILWGEQHAFGKVPQPVEMSFNRRGDSLGGATLEFPVLQLFDLAGFNRRGDSLGGATRVRPGVYDSNFRFNRRGDSLGGATEDQYLMLCHLVEFQSQRRFFGGSNFAIL